MTLKFHVKINVQSDEDAELVSDTLDRRIHAELTDEPEVRHPYDWGHSRVIAIIDEVEVTSAP